LKKEIGFPMIEIGLSLSEEALLSVLDE